VKVYAAVILCMVSLIGLASSVSAGDGQSQNQDGNVRPVERITVWYATLRNKNDGPSNAEIYAGSRGELRSGICSMDFLPNWRLTPDDP